MVYMLVVYIVSVRYNCSSELSQMAKNKIHFWLEAKMHAAAQKRVGAEGGGGVNIYVCVCVCMC